MPDAMAEVTGGNRGPLSGVRVLSLAELYPGPFATLILADLGADVIMVERPSGGDATRRFSGHFAGLNRGKRSIALDLKSVDGVDVFMKLASTVDVVIEGFRPGTVKRLGIGPEELRARFPELIYISISSFGQFGPLSPRASHDLSAQGMAGFVEDEKPNPLPLADLASALFAAVGITSALFARGRGASGATIDVAMLDALIALRTTSLVSTLNDLDPAPYPPLDPGYGVFRLQDGRQVAFAIDGEDHQWQPLCEELGLHDLAGLATHQREKDAVNLRARLQTALLAADWPSVEQALEARGVGFGPVYGDQDVADDSHVRARRMIVEVEDGSGLRVIRQPIVFDGVPGRVTRGVSDLGADTTEVLREVGLDAAEIQALMDTGAAGVPMDRSSS
jgi:crotonobetainyl-CoA:carnitine CoA-transferase CaiB-like acyl-CoA transferase